MVEWLETHSSSAASSVPDRAATARARWTKKVLSFGSTTSSTETERCTDLDKLDMAGVAADGVLALDGRTAGGYCGYVHVAQAARRGRQTFVKRYCRLEELVCRFYTSADEAEHGARPVGRHVIIAVHRVHARNKTFAVTDYEDRTVLLHTCLGADFEHWYSTFAGMVRVTQVAKPRPGGGSTRRATAVPCKEATRLCGVLQNAYRLRALTAPMLPSWSGGTSHESDGLVVRKDAEDCERSYTVWLYVQAPRWHHLVQRRQRLRQYFVFAGTTVSCFSVNKEGKRAAFTCTVTACNYDREQDASVVEVECGHPQRKLRLSSSTNDAESAVAATAEYIQAALATRTDYA